MALIVPEYDDYISGGGTLTAAEFAIYLNKGIYCLNHATFGAYDKCDTSNTNQQTVVAIKDCLCAIVDYLAEIMEDGSAKNTAITSERVGNWSVTYDSSGICPNYLYYIKTQIVELYLGNTNLPCRWA